jgi:hypothetical protein
VVWECSLRRKIPEAAISRLLRLLRNAGVTSPFSRITPRS